MTNEQDKLITAYIVSAQQITTEEGTSVRGMLRLMDDQYIKYSVNGTLGEEMLKSKIDRAVSIHIEPNGEITRVVF